MVIADKGLGAAAAASADVSSGLRAIVTTGNSANRVDIVFLGDGYTASQLSTTYTAGIHNYLSYLFDDSALTQPFGRYEKFFNVYAVDVASNQTGADDPTAGITRDTALDATYNGDGFTQRLLVVNQTKATAALTDALSGSGISAEMRYVLVNDTQYGGSGGYFGVYAAGNDSARELALHEIGHSFAGLADEYGGNTGTYTGGEPSQVDVTTFSSGAKWAEWLGYNDPILGVVGAYEGGYYYDHGIYRPTFDSKMRDLNRPFDPIAREQFIHTFYQFVDPLDGYDNNSGTRKNVAALHVDVIDPNVILVDWTVNGQKFVNAGQSFDFSAHGFHSGTFTVTARAYDPTDWVRGDRSDLEESVTWTVALGGSNPPVIVSDGGGATAALARPENATAVTHVVATDPDEGTSLSFAIVGGADAARFQINSLTGALAFKAAPDFEAPADSDHNNSYVVQVRASDGALSDTQTITVNVSDVAPHINGTSGNNTLVGTAENDTIQGLAGADTMTGKAGNDIYFVDNAGDRVFEAAGGGSDRVNTSVSFALGAGQSVELIATTNAAGTAPINLTGNDVAQAIYGNAGKNVIDGKGGADNLYGGPGDDSYVVDNAGDRVFEAAGGGSDRVSASASYALRAGQSVELFTTANGAGTTAINLTGNDAAQTINGNAGNNILDGGAGSDRLTGGGGNDVFKFDTALNASTNVDRVTDFVHGQDKFYLENAVFKALPTTGMLAAGAFFIGAAAHDADDRIIYNASTGALIYDANGSAAGGATQFAILGAHLTINFKDFFVI